MKSLVLLMGFCLVMSIVMVGAMLTYGRGQQQNRPQIVLKPRRNMNYLSQSIVRG